jgi:hypothetical protein
MNLEDEMNDVTDTEMAGLRRVLSASAPEPALPELTMERLRAASLAARRRRQWSAPLAVAASLALLLGGLMWVPGGGGAVDAPGVGRVHPLVQDPLLTELELLDLQVQELAGTEGDLSVFPTKDELIWEEL